LRYEKQIKKFFKTKGHTHHCRSHFIAGVKKEEEEKSQQQALFKIPKIFIFFLAKLPFTDVFNFKLFIINSRFLSQINIKAN